jgi:hypothetical protein
VIVEVQVSEEDRALALRKVKALQRMPLTERERLIGLIPGLGGEKGQQLAYILDKLPEAAIAGFVKNMKAEELGFLRYANGIIPEG